LCLALTVRLGHRSLALLGFGSFELGNPGQASLLCGILCVEQSLLLG
jgi:hypothetical protein